MWPTVQSNPGIQGQGSGSGGGGGWPGTSHTATGEEPGAPKKEINESLPKETTRYTQ